MTGHSQDDRDSRDSEAALWCARMTGGDAVQYQSTFENWLRADPRNLEAYNSMAEIHLLGRKLKAVGPEQAKPNRTSARYLGLLLACALLLALLLLLARAATQNPAHTPAGQTQMAQAGRSSQLLISTSESKAEVLPDGSRILLDANSRVKLAFTSDRRRLVLERGGARFEVAHEPRPFTVSAGGGSVTARGTIFHVALRVDRKVEVNLIRGRVDVDLPHTRMVEAAEPRHMEAGDRLSFSAAPPAPEAPPPAAGRSELSLTPGTLGALVADSNASARDGSRITLADPDLGRLPISGSFQVHDPETIAQRLAVIFDLVIERPRPGVILLKRAP
ncbi:MAG TPA: FecR domain-containing protein [Sphingobium sp.]